ncbi:MAG: group II intron reverse transcriptase/maturase, partial [Deltaproteobacteria bacterium]|nr:group II intron reverse transcriptase/maturase [Deltaproteobacteria bacterium]
EESSHGFRPERGCKDALREVDELIKEGYTFAVDADMDSYLDTSLQYTSVHEWASKRVGC